LVGTQESPAVQATQTPPLQIWPVPHDMPFGLLPDSKQTAAPVLQTVIPVRQGLPATEQLAPETHEAQVPVVSQTRLVPQAVPAATFAAVSLHPTVAPQTRFPSWQGLVGVQAPPAEQATQLPL
jgi:hypothetical protein